MFRRLLFITLLMALALNMAMAFERNTNPWDRGSGFDFSGRKISSSEFISVAPLTTLDIGFEGDSLPGWVFYDADENGYHWTLFNSPALAHSGNGFMGAYYDTLNSPPLPNDDWMVSPPITVDDSSYVLSFWIASQETHFEWLDSYQLWISTTDNELTSFTDSIDGQINIPSNWGMKIFSLEDYVGETIYIAWRCTSHDDFILKIDDVHIGEPLPYAIGLDPTYAYGTVASGSQFNYRVAIHNFGGESDEYGLSVGSTGGWVFNIEDTMGNPLTITPTVASGETYEFNVNVDVPTLTDTTLDSFSVEVTSIGDPSGDITQTVRFYPSAVPANSIPYSSGFDTNAESAGWLIANTGAGLYDWFLIDTAYVDSAYIASMPYAGVAWQDSSDQDIWLISPLIDLTGVTSAHIQFDQLGIYGVTSYDYHGLWASYTNASPRWLEHEWFEVEELGAALENDYETVTYSLDELVGNYVYLAFRYQGYWADIWFVDNIIIDEGASVDDHSRMAEKYELAGNTPNPFNAATTIRTTKPGTGVIEIIDMNGRIVRELPIDGGSAIWNGRANDGEEVPCGIYFYRLSGTDDVRRMVLLK